VNQRDLISWALVNSVCDALNASVDVRNRAQFHWSSAWSHHDSPIAVNAISSISGIRSIVQRKTLLLGFRMNPTGFEPKASWFRCKHLTKVTHAPLTDKQQANHMNIGTFLSQT